MNKDNQPKNSDEDVTRSGSSKVGDVFPSTSLEEYANKSGRVSGLVGHSHVADDENDDDDCGASEPESDDEHDLRQDSDANEHK